MDFENTFQVDAPIDEVYSALLDVGRVAPCVPGAQVYDRTGDDAYEVGIKVKVGPMSMLYKGTVEIIDRDPDAHTASMRARARESRGQGMADATVQMALATDDGTTTRGTISSDVKLSGKAAAMGGGVIREVSGKLVDQFATNLEAMLSGEGVATQPMAAAETRVQATPAEAAPPADAPAAAEAAPAETASAASTGAQPTPAAAAAAGPATPTTPPRAAARRGGRAGNRRARRARAPEPPARPEGARRPRPADRDPAAAQAPELSSGSSAASASASTASGGCAASSTTQRSRLGRGQLVVGPRERGQEGVASRSRRSASRVRIRRSARAGSMRSSSVRSGVRPPVANALSAGSPRPPARARRPGRRARSRRSGRAAPTARLASSGPSCSSTSCARAAA